MHASTSGLGDFGEQDKMQNMKLETVLKRHEEERKRAYNRRVMEIEHGSFIPLVFTTAELMSHACSIDHKTLAKKLSKKKDERYDAIVR